MTSFKICNKISRFLVHFSRWRCCQVERVKNTFFSEKSFRLFLRVRAVKKTRHIIHTALERTFEYASQEFVKNISYFHEKLNELKCCHSEHVSSFAVRLIRSVNRIDDSVLHLLIRRFGFGGNVSFGFFLLGGAARADVEHVEQEVNTGREEGNDAQDSHREADTEGFHHESAEKASSPASYERNISKINISESICLIYVKFWEIVENYKFFLCTKI